MHNKPTVNVAKLKSLREEKEWSQSDLERESGVAQAHISRIEAGLTPNVSAVILGTLAQTLGVSIDFLLDLTSNPLPSPNPSKLSLMESLASDPLIQRLLANFQALSTDHAKRTVVNILEIMVKKQAERDEGTTKT